MRRAVSMRGPKSATAVITVFSSPLNIANCFHAQAFYVPLFG